MDKICGVYVIGLPDGRIYVGSSIDCARRRRAHWALLRAGRHHNYALQYFVNHNGVDALTFTIHSVCKVSEQVELEQAFIDACPAQLRLNTAQDASACMAGRRHSPAAKAKMATAKLGIEQTPAHKARISAANKGRVLTASHRAAFSNARSGVKLSTNTSGYCGVSARRNKWRAQVRVEGKQRMLGDYATAELAYAMRLVYIAALPHQEA